MPLLLSSSSVALLPSPGPVLALMGPGQWLIRFFLNLTLGANIKNSRKKGFQTTDLPIAGPSTLKLMLSGSMSVIPCRARYHCTSLFDLFKVIKFIIILSRTQKADSPKLVPLGAVDIDVIFPGRLASRPHYHLVSSVRISDKRRKQKRSHLPTSSLT